MAGCPDKGFLLLFFFLFFFLHASNFFDVFFVFFGGQKFIEFRGGGNIHPDDPTILVRIFVDNFRRVQEFGIHFHDFPGKGGKEIVHRQLGFDRSERFVFDDFIPLFRKINPVEFSQFLLEIIRDPEGNPVVVVQSGPGMVSAVS
jgi:hypothetical protein